MSKTITILFLLLIGFAILGNASESTCTLTATSHPHTQPLHTSNIPSLGEAWGGLSSEGLGEVVASSDSLTKSEKRARRRPTLQLTDSLLYTKSKKRLFLLRWLDRALEVDTNYIERNKYNVTLMTQADWRFKYIWLRGSGDNGHQSLYFRPHSQVTIGPYVGYSLLFLGWSIDIGSKLTAGNSNLYLSAYAPMFGIDYYYENDVNGYRFTRTRGFSDEINRQCEGMSFPGLSTDMRYLHAYYIFNHRHFSYPAAYSQSTVQRRTSGALILGYSYSRQIVNFDYDQLPAPFWGPDGELLVNNALKVKQVRYTNHSLSLGYSFNWVLAHNLLFNATASPSMGYNFTRGEKATSDKLYRLRNVNFDFVGKLGFVWNTNHFFAGGSFTAHTYAYRKSTFSCQNALFSAQIYTGVNLWRKKAQKGR